MSDVKRKRIILSQDQKRSALDETKRIAHEALEQERRSLQAKGARLREARLQAEQQERQL
jgi:hypothetical protein